MSKEKVVLKIFCLHQPLISTEWKSLMGDKFCYALPFNLSFVESIEEASVIVWDGVVSHKMKRILPDILVQFQKGKILLLMGESHSLFKGSRYVELLNIENIQLVQLSGWSVLPEEILGALETCYQKIINV
jgi:Ni,Fe-hydrogenase III small subunit